MMPGIGLDWVAIGGFVAVATFLWKLHKDRGGLACEVGKVSERLAKLGGFIEGRLGPSQAQKSRATPVRYSAAGYNVGAGFWNDVPAGRPQGGD